MEETKKVAEKTKAGVVTGRHEPGKLLAAQRQRKEMTPAETALWHHLRGNRLCGLHFRRQQVIDGFIADFYRHAIGLVIELDGPVHDRQAEYDAERDRMIRERGICILRFTNSQITNDRPHVLAEIKATIRRLSPSVTS